MKLFNAMKRYPILGVVVVCGVAVFVPRTRAQSLIPEFRLDLHYHDAGNGGNGYPVAFGYDARATDGIDTAFGEAYYPPVVGPGGFYLAFQISDTEASLIDIMYKPGTDTFTIQYPLVLSAFEYPATLSWDRYQIPSQIKAITIAPPGNHTRLMADMTKQDSVVITTDLSSPDYALNWMPAIITVYYNFAPAAVENDFTADAGLISKASVYPNPMVSNSVLDLTMNDAALVTIEAYDVTGRELMYISRNVGPGDAVMGLNTLPKSSGAVLLRIDASSSSRHETRTVMAMRE